MRRRRRWIGIAVAVVVLGAIAAIGINALLSNVVPQPPACTLGRGDAQLDFDPEQAADASTIAAVAKRRGLPNHAVTIALATALQESKLFNVGYGDRDSVGIFQQRPSQGWGTPKQLIDPAYAAEAFYSHLEKVPTWQTLPVAEAAQRVQHSADGSAYAQWEEQARALARALTGEIPAGLTCRWSDKRTPKGAELTAAATRELGSTWRAGGDAGRDWTVAEWLVAHSYQFGISTVTARGQRWTARSGAWRARSGGHDTPAYELVKGPSRG